MEKLSIVFPDFRRYDGEVNLKSRIEDLYAWGHGSSVWGFESENGYAVTPPAKGHVIEILSSDYVSRPCWEEIFELADHTDTVELDFQPFIEWDDELGLETIHQFFFLDIDSAREMALKVRKSARNKRKNLSRRIRLEDSGGFHNKWALDCLYEIQKGRCYYSGDPLTNDPKNFVVDHIQSIYHEGTDWPENIALVLKDINTWKGGIASPEDTIRWLANKRGSAWLRAQKNFCKEVDEKRKKLDLEFRQRFAQR